MRESLEIPTPQSSEEEAADLIALPIEVLHARFIEQGHEWDPIVKKQVADHLRAYGFLKPKEESPLHTIDETK